MNKFAKSALLGATMLGFAGAATAQDATVVDAAVANPNLTTLVAGVQAAGLAETLAGEGPFTIFAPADSAFATLPAGALDELLLPENQEQLIEILQGHVVPGIYTSQQFESALLEPTSAEDDNLSVTDQVISLDSLTVAGLEIEKRGQSFYVSTGTGEMENVQIIEADIEASNGVIHIIDGVLMP